MRKNPIAKQLAAAGLHDCAKLLRRWLEDHPTVTQTALCREAQIQRSGLTETLQGKRYPSLAAAIRLSVVTGIPVEKLANPRSVLIVPAASDRVVA